MIDELFGRFDGTFSENTLRAMEGWEALLFGWEVGGVFGPVSPKKT